MTAAPPDDAGDQPDDAGTDPVLVQRARFARWAGRGKRLGYSLLLVAVAAFAIGWTAGFGGAVTVVVAAAMAGATVTLAPAIVVGYAVGAAERDDRRRGLGTGRGR